MTKDSGEKEKLSELITSCGFFTNISPETITSLENKFVLVTLDEGEVLFNQGDQPEYFYILVSGKLTTFLTKANCQKIMVGYIFPFEPVGELGSISMEPRSMTVMGHQESTLLRLPSAAFRELCFEHPSVAAKLSSTLVSRSLQTLKLMTYEKLDNNVVLIYSNAINNDLLLILKNKFFALNEADLEFVSVNKIKIDQLESKINEARSKKIHLLFFMENFNEAFFQAIQKWLTHFYIVINAEEKEFSNMTKTILFELKKFPNIRNELIIIHPNKTKKIVNTRKWLERADFKLHHHLKLNNANDFFTACAFYEWKSFRLSTRWWWC